MLIYKILVGYLQFYYENTFATYQKYISGRIEFPRHSDFHTKDIVSKLLAAYRTKWLGNLKNGAKDIKKHKWFN